MTQAEGNIKLLLMEPKKTGSRNFIIAFISDSKNECMAYNWAIESILKREGLSPYHHHAQEELVKQHAPGYHEWEIREDGEKESLLQLMNEIEERARETEDIFEQFGAEIE